MKIRSRVGDVLIPIVRERRRLETVFGVVSIPLERRSAAVAVANNESGKGKQQMQLTDQKAICRATNTSEADFIMAHARKLARQIPVTATQQERAVAVHSAGAGPVRVHGLDPVFKSVITFQRTHDAGNLRTALASLTNIAANKAAGFLTPAQLEICHATRTDPARFALAAHGQSALPDPGQSADMATCLSGAQTDIQNFLKDPDHLDALQFLISASAWLRQALRQAGAADRQAGGW